MDPNTVLVLFGTRHGNRNPEEYLPENPRTWGYEGFTELTSFGKRQGYGLGKELRKFIGNLTSNNYNASEVKYYSSSANRCQMTLQVAVAGLHPPETYAEWNTQLFDHWSPIPYTIDDPLLRMYSVSECKNSDKVWAPIDNDQLPHLKAIQQSKKAVLDYMRQYTGWNTTNLGNAADVADNLIEIDLYQSPYPDWITNPKIANYNSASLKEEILSFAEIHQIACAEYEPCRNLMAGYWLNDVLSRVRTSNESKGPKIVGYASHTEITLSIMKLMGYERDELTTSAGFVIEFRRVPYPSVRLLNHDPNPIDQHVIYRANLTQPLAALQDAQGFIELRKFDEVVRGDAFSNWRVACGICNC